MHAVKADGGCRQIVSFTPQPLYSREKRQQYPLTIEEGWVLKLSERLAEKKHLAPASNWTIMARMSIPYPRHYIHWVNPFLRTATPKIIETRPRVSRFRSSDGHKSLPHYVVILCTFWKKTEIFYSDVRHVRETNAKSDSCLRHVWPAGRPFAWNTSAPTARFFVKFHIGHLYWNLSAIFTFGETWTRKLQALYTKAY